MTYQEKYKVLIDQLKSYKKVVVAFSGGVDSTFLLYAAKEALGENVLAVTIMSPYIPKWEIEEARELSASFGVRHEIIQAGIIDEIRNNPEDRCYLCKKAVFGKIIAAARDQGIDVVADGTNYDDMGDYRPGLRALGELEVKSPLKDSGLTKAEIRLLSKEAGLSTWDKPAYACLLTRIPYNTKLEEEAFIKIEAAEKIMMDAGFKAVRVRCHGDLARIEISREDRKRILDENLLDELSVKIKEAGFRYVTLDLEGYKMGSFNDTIEKR
ncbi:MAG: ATP-dependent sacrificial sulfur transferase LarE [Eubacteriaceae bacterium]|nr:ATP-dependent sacrificial sulfur transferase LarE [Eubacteriaceae bacterium]